MNSVPMECYLVTPLNALEAIGAAKGGDVATMMVLQAMAETLRLLRRSTKTCMLSGCGRRLGGVTGKDAPVAFCILIPMFPNTGPHTEQAICSPICLDCMRRGDLMTRMKETLATDFECRVSEAVPQ